MTSLITSSAPFFLAQSSVLRVLDPDSPNARSIFDLGIVTTIILGAIFVIVAGLVVYSLMRFRWREGEPDPKQVAGNTKVEIIWTAIPCLIVIALFALTARTMSLSDPPPAPEPDLIVTGHRWWWEASYPHSGITVANEIHLPAGRAFSLRLESTDVLHEFWVPELARKITAVPGHPNAIWLEADKPGTYLGICSEFCGTQHAWMHFQIVVDSPADFAAWEKAQQKAAATPTTPLAIQGLALFREKTCVSCHAVDGLGTAREGPNLTHFASRKQLGAGVADNTSENVQRWLADPQSIKPGCLMPDFHLGDKEVSALTAYLETLR
ncbi:MAG: cytochrome c oxidase subunit II [Lacunisphaera sp.]